MDVLETMIVDNDPYLTDPHLINNLKFHSDLEHTLNTLMNNLKYC